MVLAVLVGGKGTGLMRSDWTGVAEVQSAEALAGATEVKAGNLPMSLLHGRTRSQLLQTVDRPERDQ